LVASSVWELHQVQYFWWVMGHSWSFFTDHMVSPINTTTVIIMLSSYIYHHTLFVSLLLVLSLSFHSNLILFAGDRDRLLDDLDRLLDDLDRLLDDLDRLLGDIDCLLGDHDC
jgi:hypothetical protein